MKLLTIIPTYNEIDNIEKLIKTVFTNIPHDAAVLVIDDNSPDGTAQLVKENSADYPGRLHILNRSEKQGCASAFLQGFAWGIERGYDAMLTMDADFSHDPKYIATLLENESDVVVGSRLIKGGGIENRTLLRNVISRGASLYCRLLLSTSIKDWTGGYNLWSKNALGKIDIKNKMDKLIYAGLFCLAFYICLASCLNPFGLKIIDIDTSVYLTIAQGITRGQVPFRDFYDNKGPLLYLISAPGFALGRFTGVWITELILMCISVFFSYKTALFFGSRSFAFFGVLLSFFIFQTFFYEVVGAEEYSLPFMTISLYIFTRYYFTQKNISSLEIMILGFCFASSMLIRINMFPLWLGFFLVIFIEMVTKRDFSGLCKYVVLFLAGISIISIPILLYLKVNGAFMDYIRQNFITGSSRGLTGFDCLRFARSFRSIISKNFCFAPLLAGLAWIARDFSGKRKGYYIAYLLAFILTVTFFAVIRTSYDHYNMALTIFLVSAFTFFAVNVYGYFRNSRYNKLLFTLFLYILFSTTRPIGLTNVFSSLTGQSRKDHILTGKIIDEQTTETDKIIELGFPAQIYLFTQRDTASRYIYQLSGVDYEPNAKNEFLTDLQNNKPAIIAIPNRNGSFDYLPEWYAPVYNMIKNEYQMITDKNGYFLFKRIHAGDE